MNCTSCEVVTHCSKVTSAMLEAAVQMQCLINYPCQSS